MADWLSTAVSGNVLLVLPWGVLLVAVVGFAAILRHGQRQQSMRDEQLQRMMLEQMRHALEHQADQFLLQLEQNQLRLRVALQPDFQAAREPVQSLTALLQQQLANMRSEAAQRHTELAAGFLAAQQRLRSELNEQLMAQLVQHARADREALQQGLRSASEQLMQGTEALSRTINERLEAITGHVNHRLDEGFRKTNETFASVMARLATIDEAQKKIDGLTTNVVNLQALLGDKRARGAFGEVQLEALVCNVLPPDAFAFQHTLSNGTRADCVLMLPEPTGSIAVDAKFPLENYHRMHDDSLSDGDRRAARSLFRADVRRHVDAIASKYILPGQTSDGAMMFVPAEAVFAEIHAYHADVVAHAMARRVWIVSPTTLMAVLNTARAVIKDVETRKQVHVIQAALTRLAADFRRFDERMQALSRHIGQAARDVEEVHVSSRKISAHFQQIESAQFDDMPVTLGQSPERDLSA